MLEKEFLSFKSSTYSCQNLGVIGEPSTRAYWINLTLFEIASGIGTTLTIDDATQSRLFGLYVRVLVDVDVSKKLYNAILVER